MTELEDKDSKTVTEAMIDNKLEELMDSAGEIENTSHVVKLLAKLVYNLRYDLRQLTYQLLAMLTDDDFEAQEELPMPPKTPRDVELSRKDYGGFYK